MNPEPTSNELISWLTTESRAIARLLTPRVLLVAAVAIVVAWVIVRAVEWALETFWRFGGDTNRRLHWLVPAARIGVSVTLAYTLLFSAFRAAPVLTVVVTFTTALLLLAAFSGSLRSAYVGLGVAWREKIRPGDRFELDGHAGIVQRFGLLRLELRDQRGATLVVPNRLLEEGVVRVEAVTHTSHVRARAKWDPGAQVTELGLRRIAILSPYRVPNSAVSVTMADTHAEIDISVWGEDARTPAAAHLTAMLERYVAGKTRRT